MRDGYVARKSSLSDLAKHVRVMTDKRLSPIFHGQ
jgi:hypothetical protein